MNKSILMFSALFLIGAGFFVEKPQNIEVFLTGILLYAFALVCEEINEIKKKL